MFYCKGKTNAKKHFRRLPSMQCPKCQTELTFFQDL